MSEEENPEELNTSQGDSGEQNTSEEIESQETSKEDTQTEESEHASPEEGDEKIDWQKRHADLQAKFTPMAQEFAEMKGRLTERERQSSQLPSAKELEEKETAELDQIMKQHKDDAARGLTGWIREREKKIASQQQASLSPVYAQMQLLGWRQRQMMEGTNWDDLMKREKKMQEVIQKNPAILQFPNALEQAEALALGTKDINQVKKEIRKQEEQRKAHTVGTSKSKAKGKKTVAQRASELYGMKFAEPK